MTSELNLAADFAQVADQLEPVTLRRADGSGDLLLPGALRRAVTTREAAISDGRYTASDVRWHLAAVDLDAAPRLGDQIIDGAGEAWTILEARQATAQSRWECTTRNLAIVGGLNSYITIRREVISKDASGAVERTWQDWRTNIRARIQEQSSHRDEQHGRQAGYVAAKVYLAEQILVDNSHRIIGPDGTEYEVIGYESPDTIGSLFVINVQQRQ